MRAVIEHVERLSNPLDGSWQSKEVKEQKIIIKISKNDNNDGWTQRTLLACMDFPVRGDHFQHLLEPLL